MHIDFKNHTLILLCDCIANLDTKNHRKHPYISFYCGGTRWSGCVVLLIMVSRDWVK